MYGALDTRALKLSRLVDFLEASSTADKNQFFVSNTILTSAVKSNIVNSNIEELIKFLDAIHEILSDIRGMQKFRFVDFIIDGLLCCMEVRFLIELLTDLLSQLAEDILTHNMLKSSLSSFAYAHRSNPLLFNTTKTIYGQLFKSSLEFRIDFSQDVSTINSANVSQIFTNNPFDGFIWIPPPLVFSWLQFQEVTEVSYSYANILL